MVAVLLPAKLHRTMLKINLSMLSVTGGVLGPTLLVLLYLVS